MIIRHNEVYSSILNAHRLWVTSNLIKAHSEPY